MSMNGFIDIVRRVVEEELARQRTTLLGVVTTVFPHTAEDDENNYDVGVKLKHEELELRRVPLAVPHIGVAAPPRVGDLVMVQFIGGDINQPVVSGRLYHSDDRPPLHKEDEILFEHRVASDGTLNHLRFGDDGSIFIQRDVTDPDQHKAKTSIRIEGSSGDLEIKLGDDVVLTMKSDKITIKGNMEIDGNVKMKGDLEVSNGSQKTTISGNSIEGG